MQCKQKKPKANPNLRKQEKKIGGRREKGERLARELRTASFPFRMVSRTDTYILTFLRRPRHCVASIKQN
jgi:hypothetical protein